MSRPFSMRLLRRAGYAIVPPDADADAAALATPVARDPLWATPMSEAPNLHRVTPSLFRSARLTHNDVGQLQALGIKTVISLRSFHCDHQALQGSGIDAVRVPVNTWSIGDRHVVQTMRAIRAAEQQGPVLLHCLHGADRTGLMVAMYRMLYQHWPRERALDELRNGGYGYHAVWKNIEKYLRRVDIDRIRRQIGG